MHYVYIADQIEAMLRDGSYFKEPSRLQSDLPRLILQVPNFVDRLF